MNAIATEGRSMKTFLWAVAVLVLEVLVLSGYLPVAVYCPVVVVPPFEVSSTTFLGICFKEHRIGRCGVYTYEGPLVGD